MNYEYFSLVFKALSDENRLKIIDILSGGSLCACKILEQFDFTQPALSQHMKVLIDCGLIRGERVGNWMHYSLAAEKYDEIIRFVKYITEDKNIKKDLINE